MVNQQEYVSFVVKKFQELAEKFKAKNEWYKGRKDTLINFSRGACIKYGTSGMPQMYETAKDYARKHLAYIETHGIVGDGIEDSLGDIAVYAIIMMYMHKVNQRQIEKAKANVTVDGE